VQVAFKKIFLFWAIITVGFAALFYLIKTFFKAHPLWPWAIPYLYIGVLILFVLYLLAEKKK